MIQKRVIGALLMREILTRYGRHNIGFLWLFAEPMMFTLGVAALWTALHMTHGSDLPIVAFALTGYSTVLLWRNMPGRCLHALQPNASLMHHAQVKHIDVYLSRIILEGLGATTSFIILSILFSALNLMSLPVDPLKVFEGWIALAFFGGSVAILIGALSEKYEIIEKIWHPLMYFTFPLSGAAFLVDALPNNAKEVFMYIPMVNAVEYIREGYFGSRYKFHNDLVYVYKFSLIIAVFALIQVRINERNNKLEF
jgi:ABC-2 type transport system permease protein/capsular polysaccharide transport system permease protein